MRLHSRNRHDLDARVRFVANTHTYYIDESLDSAKYVSTTKLVRSMFKSFEADEVIAKMMKSKSWGESQYYGMSPVEIKIKWENLQYSAAKSGTLMHENIEKYLNGDRFDKCSREFELFKRFQDDHKNLVPYRTEWRVFDEDSSVAGSVDIVYTNSESPGDYVIVDWKRSKAIKTENKWQSGVTEKCSKHLPDCNFSHYSLQLATYKYILQKNYGIKISETLIVILHPSQLSYIKMSTRDLTPEVLTMMTNRGSKKK